MRFELGCVLDCLKEEEDTNDDGDDKDGNEDAVVAYLMNQRGKQSQLEVVTNLGTFLDELLEGKRTMTVTEWIVNATLNKTIRDAEMNVTFE